MDVSSQYRAFLISTAFPESGLSALDGLNFAVDCSNGMASLHAQALFPKATIINATMDGRFPAHSPNPLNASAREQISTLVRTQGLDCGVIFDGDADRAMFVDERGEFVQPDYLIPIVANAGDAASRRVKTESSTTKASRRVPVVLHDVRTSRGAIETLREKGFEPVMVPVGHAFAKPKMREYQALCGGELAGHYYFGDFFGCDSGILAALRILSELAAAKARGETFSQMMEPIVSRYANSGELNFKVADKDMAIARVLKKAASALPPEIGRSEIDGYRIEYEDGWISIRKSNTEPYLRLLVEAKTPHLLSSWVNLISEEIRACA